MAAVSLTKEYSFAKLVVTCDARQCQRHDYHTRPILEPNCMLGLQGHCCAPVDFCNGPWADHSQLWSCIC